MLEQQDEKGKLSGKERLMQAAQVLAQEKTFDEITIEEIIKGANLSRPAFYYHFAGGKEELRAELIQRGVLIETRVLDTRQVLLEAALRVLARTGIAATLDDIAAEAGVTRGALCWHFHSKEDLLLAILKHYGPHSMLRPVLDQIEEDLSKGVFLDDETIFRRLAGAFYDAFTGQSDHARLAVLLVYTHPEIAKLLVDKIVKGRKVIVEYVQKRQEEGYFRRDIQPGFFVQVLSMTFALRAIAGSNMNDLLLVPDFSKEEVVNQIVSLLLYGIVRRDGQP